MPEEVRRVFVLMSFDESFADIYLTLIKGAFETAGFKVFRTASPGKSPSGIRSGWPV